MAKPISLISGELEKYLKWRNPPTPGPNDRVKTWGEDEEVRKREKRKTLNYFERKDDNERGMAVYPRKYIGSLGAECIS